MITQHNGDSVLPLSTIHFIYNDSNSLCSFLKWRENICHVHGFETFSKSEIWHLQFEIEMILIWRMRDIFLALDWKSCIYQKNWDSRCGVAKIQEQNAKFHICQNVSNKWPSQLFSRHFAEVKRLFNSQPIIVIMDRGIPEVLLLSSFI